MTKGDDLIERLLEHAADLNRVAWSRTDGGQECCLNAALAEQAAEEITRLQATIQTAALWFDEYAEGHAAKGAEDKARRNRDRAAALRATMAGREDQSDV
jgi:hypothetical protein